MKPQNILHVWVLKSQRKKNHFRSCPGFLKCIRIQQVHVLSLHLKYEPQDKFLNLFSMRLILYISKSKVCIKNAKFLSNYNKFRVLQIPHHSIVK